MLGKNARFRKIPSENVRINNNERNSKQAFVSRRYVYARNPFKTSRIYIWCFWINYLRQEKKINLKKGTGNSRYIHGNELDKA